MVLDILVIMVGHSVEAQNLIQQINGHRQCISLYRCLTKKLTTKKETKDTTGNENTHVHILAQGFIQYRVNQLF